MGFEHVVCNFCKSNDQWVLFNIHESPDERQPPAWRGSASIPVVRCKQCGLVFLNPRYDDARLTALYQDPQMFIGTIDPEGRSRSIAAERPQRVARFKGDVDSLRRMRSSGRLLDIGCGLGFFLQALGNDYDAIGLEWSHPVVEMMRDLPLRVVEERFPHHPFKAGEFDIVTMHNILDHLPNPLSALHAACDLLKPGGLLMLSLVNFDSIAAKVYGAGFRLLGPNHLYYFTPTTLRRYFDRTGFRLIKIEYPYFGTEFAKPIEHTQKILNDWWAMRVMGKNETRLSPPFYGNMMRVYASRKQ
ncbi:MAG: class I SAM-dependent methyltransferase [Chloroflexi bacterium]|nr:class I SAM-dependent methyltransferase [Chloroflexota bacterium]